MKALTKTLIVFVVFWLPQIAISADQGKPKVTISPSVQEQLQKLSSNERKRVEAAIAVGNKYVPYHFDGTAYAMYDEQEKKIWQRNIRPLVNRGSVDWYNPGGVFVDGAPELEINGIKVTFAVVCPRPDLISVGMVEDHFELKYRTRIIGMWRSTLKRGSMTLDDTIQDDLILDKKEEYSEVLIMLDKNNKVSRIAAKYVVYPTIPKRSIDKFESYIKWPPRRIYQGAEHAEQETEEQARARIPQYKKFIELIKRAETTACGGTSSNSNQQQGRE